MSTNQIPPPPPSCATLYCLYISRFKTVYTCTHIYIDYFNFLKKEVYKYKCTDMYRDIDPIDD